MDGWMNGQMDGQTDLSSDRKGTFQPFLPLLKCANQWMRTAGQTEDGDDA